MLQEITHALMFGGKKMIYLSGLSINKELFIYCNMLLQICDPATVHSHQLLFLTETPTPFHLIERHWLVLQRESLLHLETIQWISGIQCSKSTMFYVTLTCRYLLINLIIDSGRAPVTLRAAKQSTIPTQEEKETIELTFSWLSWLAVLLVGV